MTLTFFLVATTGAGKSNKMGTSYRQEAATFRVGLYGTSRRRSQFERFQFIHC